MAKKVLVVDDEKLIVKGIRFSLEQDGMEVTCAYDGEEALRLATENQFDMILLDIMLPKMDGFEVCQHIRDFSNVPIVMLTAKGDDMDKILGLEYGADDYITKPFNILEVKAIKAIEDVKWIPEWGEDRIKGMVRDRSDWCISRQRTWGVPIPIIYCKDCKKPIVTDETIKAISDLFRKEGADAWWTKELSEFIPDTVKCECGCHAAVIKS